MNEHITKPWGHEIIWARTDKYVGKILHINAGEALSLQYHRVKEETILVLSGEIRFQHGRVLDTIKTRDVELPIIDAVTTILGPHESFHIKPGVCHRMTAIKPTDIVEVSTPELDDVVRLADRYGRACVEISRRNTNAMDS